MKASASALYIISDISSKHETKQEKVNNNTFEPLFLISTLVLDNGVITGSFYCVNTVCQQGGTLCQSPAFVLELDQKVKHPMLT